MIFYETLESNFAPIQKCLNYLKNDRLPVAGECVELGEGIRCIGGSYETIPEAEAVWEAHKKNADLHCLLSGKEKIGVAYSDTCQPGPYNEKEDFYLTNAVAAFWVKMEPGTALCLFPKDAHQVKVRMQNEVPVQVTKVVFKIPVELFSKDAEPDLEI